MPFGTCTYCLRRSRKPSLWPLESRRAWKGVRNSCSSESSWLQHVGILGAVGQLARAFAWMTPSILYTVHVLRDMHPQCIQCPQGNTEMSASCKNMKESRTTRKAGAEKSMIFDILQVCSKRFWHNTGEACHEKLSHCRVVERQNDQ